MGIACIELNNANKISSQTLLKELPGQEIITAWSILKKIIK